MGNGPSWLKAGAANLTGRRWGLKPGRLLSLPQVCESLRTREGRNPGTDAQAKRPAPLNVPLSCSSNHPRLIASSRPALRGRAHVAEQKRAVDLHAGFDQSIARSEIQIGFVRPTPDALSFDHTVVSHLLQSVFDARR